MHESRKWPPEIAEYLRRFVLEIRSPAFLLTDAEGKVVSAGGDLRRYGLDDLRRGDRAAEQAYFLEGLLPSNGESSALSRVETSSGTYADIHLFRVKDADCILLLDDSEEVAERTRIEQAFRETEELLRQAEKMEALGRLAGGVAHDFNNLLTVILGYSQMLADAGLSDKFAEAAHEIVMAAKKATAVTQQLLSFSRRQVRRIEVVNLNSLVSEVERLLQRLIGEDIAVSEDLADNLASVEVDRGQIEQILVNLAANARDAMPSGGRLEIRTMNVAVDEAFLCKHPSVKLRYGPHVSMTMTDTGCGMDADTCARAFEPFFTSKPAGRGTGLGLSIVYGIVTQAGGDVLVTSAVGKGTRVEILLPAVQKAITAKLAAAAESTPMGNETILVVEDEVGVRNLIDAILTDLGYTVLSCSEPFEAIRLSKQRQHRIDLLVTDLILPHIDGTLLAESLTVERPEMRVLYVSGYPSDSFSERRVKFPSGVFLRKPFTRGMLADKVREALGPYAVRSVHP